MMYAIKNRDNLEKLEDVPLLQNQVRELRLQDKLGKQNFHEDSKILYEPFTYTIKDTSRDKTNTMIESSTENNKAISDLNEKVLELMILRV